MTKRQYWKLCLKVARAKPYWSAISVEAEAALIMLGVKPEPKE